MSDQASTDLIRFSRSPAFRDRIQYLSVDPRCRNAWRLSTTVPSYFPRYKGFSSFLDTETIKVMSCILFHEDLSASIRHIIGDIQVERLWLLGRAIDAVQAIKCRIADWAAAAPALLTLADHQHELVGIGDRRTQQFDHIMWYTKAALMLTNDHLPAKERLDWNRPEYSLSLYLYMKKEQGICLCVHREGLSHASCCATLFKLYSLPIEALWDANVSIFSEADPNAHPRSELRGLIGKLEACGYPMLPPMVDHDIHGASVHPKQIPNAPKALRSGTISGRLPSAPSNPSTLTHPTEPSLPSKQPPNAPRALMFRSPSKPGRPPTPQYGQNTTTSLNGKQSAPSSDHTKRSSSTPTTLTTQHQLPPRPPTFEHPPRRYYGRSGVYVGRRLAYPLAEAMGRPESYSTSAREQPKHSYQPLNQYIMQLHSPRPVSHSNGPPPTQSRSSEIIAPSDRAQSTAHKRDRTHRPLHLTHTSTPSTSSSSTVAPLNTKPADHDRGQSRRGLGGNGGGKEYSHSRTFSSDVSVVETTPKSPEDGEADMEVDDLDSHLGTILAVADDPPEQSEDEREDGQDFPPDKNGRVGEALRVASTIDSWVAGFGSDSGTQVESSTIRLDSRVEKSDITPPILNEGLAEVKLMERTAVQVLPQSHGQKLNGLANDGRVTNNEEIWHLLPKKSGLTSWWKSSKTGKVVRLFRGEALPGHGEQDTTMPMQQSGSTVDHIAVAPDSGETGTGDEDRLNVSEENGRSAEVVDVGNPQGAAPLVTQTATLSNNTPNVFGDKKPEVTTQQNPAIVTKELTGFDSSPTESHIRRSTRSSMGLLKKKSYAESSEDEQARVSHSSTDSGSKGAAGQVSKQKRNDAIAKGTTGIKASRSVVHTDKPLVTVAASSSTSSPMQEMQAWEVHLRMMPNWGFELEMWKERELFRRSATGHWDDRPFNIPSPQEKRWQAEVAKLRVDGNQIPPNQLGYNLPWELGIAINLPPSTGSNPSHTLVSIDQNFRSGNAPQMTEGPLTTTSMFVCNHPMPVPAPVRKKAGASMTKVTARAPSNLSGRRMNVAEKTTRTPKGPNVGGKEGSLGAILGSSTPQSPSKAESMNSIGQPLTQPWTELRATQPQRTDGVIDLRDDDLANNRPKESQAKGGVDGNNRSKPIAKRRRKADLRQDLEGIASVRKKRKVDVAAEPTSADTEAVTHCGAGSILRNTRLELEGVNALSSEEGACSRPRFVTTGIKTVTETSIDILSAPVDTTTGPHTPSLPYPLWTGRVGNKQISISSPERTGISQVMAVEERVVSNATSTLQGHQILQSSRLPQGALATVAAKKCLALRFFDSQRERRREDGEAEKSRLLDAISWLTDLVLDANKAEVGTEGIVFTGEYAENLVTKLDEKIPITLWRKGLRLVIELADGTTTSLEPFAAQSHDDTVNHRTTNGFSTGKADLSHYPKERPIDPATHWPVLAFCASNRRMIMDEPKQEAQRIIQLLNSVCDLQLEETDWTLEEAFSHKTENGSEIVVPRVTIATTHAREKVFMSFTPKATKRLAKSNILIFTDDAPFLWKPNPMDFGTLRTVPQAIETDPPFVSVSIPSIHPKPIFRPQRWVSSQDATTAPPLAFHDLGDYGNGTYQYCYKPIMPMNDADWGNMTRSLKFNI